MITLRMAMLNKYLSQSEKSFNYPEGIKFE